MGTEEFDFSCTAEQRARAKALIKAGRAGNGFLPGGAGFYATATNAAAVLHRQERLVTEYSEDLWPLLTVVLEQQRHGTGFGLCSCGHWRFAFRTAAQPRGRTDRDAPWGRIYMH